MRRKTIKQYGLCRHFPFAEYRQDGNSSLLGNFRKFQTATTLYSLATGCGRKERQANFPNPCASAYCEVSRRWTRRMASLSSAFPAKRFRLFATNERRRILRMFSASAETYGQRNFYPLRHFRLYSECLKNLTLIAIFWFPRPIWSRYFLNTKYTKGSTYKLKPVVDRSNQHNGRRSICFIWLKIIFVYFNEIFIQW